MDEILDNPTGWRFQDAADFDFSMFLWFLGIAYLMVMVAVIVRAILGRRRELKATKVGKSFSTYKREGRSSRKELSEL